MRDIAIFLIVFSILPFCFKRPYIGLLLYSWLSIMNPHKLAWGLAYSFPFAEVVALITISGALLSFFGKNRPSFPWERESVLLVILFALFTVTNTFALLPEEAWPEWQQLAKVFLMTFLTLILIDDEKKFRYLALVVAGSVGFFGLKGGLFSLATGGRSMVFGSGGMIEDNTALGLALVMVVPLMFFLARVEKNHWLRMLLYSAFFLSVIATVFTYSRGAWLGLTAVCSLIIIAMKPRYIVAIGVLAFLLVPVIITKLPDRAADRAMTLQSIEVDGSAQKRLTAWATAWEIALDRPLIGGGFTVVDDVRIGSSYNPNFTSGDVGVHSIYFEVLGENGFVTFGVFLALILLSLLSTRHIGRTADSSNLKHFANYAQMLKIGIIGYTVSGAFLEAAHFDLFYTLVAMVIILKRLQANVQARPASRLLTE
jgi:probable O-glycosylation ligase (exosortase A-associated)